MITDRDKRIIKYIKDKGEVSGKELHDLFFTGKTVQLSHKRLKDLTDRGHLKRKKGIDDRYYIYYL